MAGLFSLLSPKSPYQVSRKEAAKMGLLVVTSHSCSTVIWVKLPSLVCSRRDGIYGVIIVYSQIPKLYDIELQEL